MSKLSTYVELRTRYIAHQGVTIVPTEFPNEPFDKPNPPSLWARFNVITGEDYQLDIGAQDKSFRTDGLIIVQLFAPMDTGKIPILTKADDISSCFRNWNGATITCRASSVKDIGNDGYGWYQANVITPFKTDEIH